MPILSLIGFFLPFNLRKKRLESPIQMTAGQHSSQRSLLEHLQQTTPSSVNNGQHLRTRTDNGKTSTFQSSSPPTNFDSKDVNKRGTAAKLAAAAFPPSAGPPVCSAAPLRPPPLLPLSTLRRAEVAACARGIQPRFYGFLKDVHI